MHMVPLKTEMNGGTHTPNIIDRVANVLNTISKFTFTTPHKYYLLRQAKVFEQKAPKGSSLVFISHIQKSVYRSSTHRLDILFAPTNLLPIPHESRVEIRQLFSLIRRFLSANLQPVVMLLSGEPHQQVSGYFASKTCSKIITSTKRQYPKECEKMKIWCSFVTQLSALMVSNSSLPPSRIRLKRSARNIESFGRCRKSTPLSMTLLAIVNNC